MIPKTIKIIDSLPINQNGKIDRKALSELWPKIRLI
jgi:acyl-CoA synthetase (AMP-forming)/AMP-acid ligase II